MRGASVLLAVLAACAGDGGRVRGLSFALDDPAGILDDVVGQLSLKAWPAASGTCDSMSGVVTPEPADAPIVDVTFDVHGQAMFMLDAGSWLLRVTGSGVDRRTGRSGLIASGCTSFDVMAGETRMIVVTMRQQTVRGTCGDTILDGDEMCDDDNTTAGDGCDERCQTEEAPINTAVIEGDQRRPVVAGADGARFAFAWDTTRPAPGIRDILRAETGALIESPRYMAQDGDVLDGLPSPGVQAVCAIAGNGMRYGIAFEDGRNTGTTQRTDIRVRLFDYDRVTAGDDVTLSEPVDGAQTSPSAAMNDAGVLLVAWNDEMGAHGARGRVVPAGFTTPMGPAFDVASTAGTATEPSAAVTQTNDFLVAFTAPDASGATDVYVRRVSATGTPAAAEAAVVTGEDAAGAQDQPSIAVLRPSGETLVVWRSSTGDGDGHAIRGRLLSATGMPTGAVLTVNTEGAGEQQLPRAVAGHGVFAVVWEDTTGGQIRGRILDHDGSALASRTRDLSDPTGDFQISHAAGMAVSPSAAIGGNNLLFVVWEDTAAPAPDGDGRGVRGRWMPIP